MNIVVDMFLAVVVVALMSACASSVLACDVALDLTAVVGDCNKFYRCDGARLFVMSCGTGTVFDTLLKVCNWPSQVANCGAPPPPVQAPLPPVQFSAPNIYPPTQHQVDTYSCHLRHMTRASDDCSRFYMCVGNILQVVACPYETWFDERLRRCILSSSSLYSCSSSLLTLPATTTPNVTLTTTTTTTTTASSTTIAPASSTREILYALCPSFDTKQTLHYFCSMSSFVNEFGHCC